MGHDARWAAVRYVTVGVRSTGGRGTMEVHGQGVHGGRRVGRICGTEVLRRPCNNPRSGIPVAMVMAHRV